MTEIPTSEILDRKLEGEELAKAAKGLRDQFSLYYKTPILENVEVRFKQGGIACLITNKVEDDQQDLWVNLGNSEFVGILVARGPLGINAIDYFSHGVETTHLKDSVRAVREAQGVFAKIFPEGKAQPTRL